MFMFCLVAFLDGISRLRFQALTTFLDQIVGSASHVEREREKSVDRELIAKGDAYRIFLQSFLPGVHPLGKIPPRID